MFRKLGHYVCRSPFPVLCIWLAVSVAAALLSPNPEQRVLSEPASLLPADVPSERALELYHQAFPDQAARSEIVLVFHRDTDLTENDHRWLKELSGLLESKGKQGLETWRVMSGELNPALKTRLESSDNKLALVKLNLDVTFITKRASRIVDEVEALVDEQPIPEGLQFNITGTAALGREHNRRSEEALHRTTKVTIAAVLIILALVYRSPLGALVPLLSIGLSVYIAFCVLDLLALLGWTISNAERTFTVVLLFGAGTDYALFWISRYREEWSRRRNRQVAGIQAMMHVGPAILASAGTTIFGLMGLLMADMILIQNAGRVLWIVLSISLLAAITLTPALAMLMGRAFFWPSGVQAQFSIGQRTVWPLIAKQVARRPYLIFVLGLVVLAVPAATYFQIQFRYDSFGEIIKESQAAQGLELVRRHFPEDELFSTNLLVQSPAFNENPQRAEEASGKIVGVLGQVEAVSDVWHMNQPMGKRREIPQWALSLAKQQVSQYYFDPASNVLRLEVMQEYPPYSLQAMEVISRLKQNVQDWTQEHLGADTTVLMVGQTPYIRDVKAVADKDLSKVLVTVIAVIWLVVVVLVRRVWLSVFMLFATLLTYTAAIGLTKWVFVDLLGREGVDYKLKILVFVIIVAVGQDYNIYLVTRMLQEIKSFSLKEAIMRSIVLTGPVISSCGLIMAATLGSISTTGVDLTQQLGFAFAVGILLDTFLVRPLLIPSFYFIIQRLRGKTGDDRVNGHTVSESPLAPGSL